MFAVASGKKGEKSGPKPSEAPRAHAAGSLHGTAAQARERVNRDGDAEPAWAAPRLPVSALPGLVLQRKEVCDELGWCWTEPDDEETNESEQYTPIELGGDAGASEMGGEEMTAGAGGRGSVDTAGEGGMGAAGAGGGPTLEQAIAEGRRCWPTGPYGMMGVEGEIGPFKAEYAGLAGSDEEGAWHAGLFAVGAGLAMIGWEHLCRDKENEGGGGYGGGAWGGREGWGGQEGRGPTEAPPMTPQECSDDILLLFEGSLGAGVSVGGGAFQSLTSSEYGYFGYTSAGPHVTTPAGGVGVEGFIGGGVSYTCEDLPAEEEEQEIQ